MSFSFTQICNRNPAYDVSAIPGSAEDVRKYVHLNVTPLLNTKTDGQMARWPTIHEKKLACQSTSINAHNGLSYMHTCLQFCVEPINWAVRLIFELQNSCESACFCFSLSISFRGISDRLETKSCLLLNPVFSWK